MLIQDLPIKASMTDEGKNTAHCSTEIAITKYRQGELEELGFIPLCYQIEGEAVGVINAPSCQKPRRLRTEEQNLRAWLSVQLVSSLAVSRIAHYLKAVIRCKANRFRTGEELQEYLSDWTSKYVEAGDSVGEQARPVLPFKKAGIEVRQDRKPGTCVVQASLRPLIPIREFPGGMKSTPVVPGWFSTDDIMVNFWFEY
jgi:type VI secretion system protein ImpC